MMAMALARTREAEEVATMVCLFSPFILSRAGHSLEPQFLLEIRLALKILFLLFVFSLPSHLAPLHAFFQNLVLFMSQSSFSSAPRRLARF
jgi:hypothetical protein